MSLKRRLQILTATALSAGLFGGVVPPASAAPRPVTYAAQEQSFTAKINAERTRRGMSPLAVDLQLTRVARAWTDKMAADDRLYHNPSMSSQVKGDWTRLGENVGYSFESDVTLARLVSRLHTAFMNSPGHRANILGAYNRVGVGVRMAAGNKMWVTVNFAKSPGLPNKAILSAVKRARRAYVPIGTSGVHARYVIITRADVSTLTLSALRSSGGPVLLTHPGKAVDPNPVLHPATRALLDTLLRDGGKVYVVGSTKAVSDRARDELATDGYTVRRVSTATAASLN